MLTVIIFWVFLLYFFLAITAMIEGDLDSNEKHYSISRFKRITGLKYFYLLGKYLGEEVDEK